MEQQAKKWGFILLYVVPEDLYRYGHSSGILSDDFFF